VIAQFGTFGNLATSLAYLTIAGGFLLAARARSDDLQGVVRLLTYLLSACFALAALAHLVHGLRPIGALAPLAPALDVFQAVIAVSAAVAFVWGYRTLRTRPSRARLEKLITDLETDAEGYESALADLEAKHSRIAEEARQRAIEAQEANRRFEAAARGSALTMFAQDRDLRYSWVHNPRLGLSPEDIIGHTDREIIPAEAYDAVAAPKLRAMETGAPETFEVELPEGESTTWFRIDIMPTADMDGNITGILSTGIDITRSKRLEEMRASLNQRLAETVQRFKLALQTKDIVVFEQDQDLVYRWTNTNESPFGAIVGKTDGDLFSGAALADLSELKRQVIRTDQPAKTEVSLTADDGSARTYEVYVEPRQATGTTSKGVVSAAVDITDRKENERRMRLVMRELTHRSKNLLAVVTAIARQTSRDAGSMEEFSSVFGQRLQSLAAAQDLIVAENWEGVDLAELISSQLAHYAPADGSRIRVEGPAIKLNPEATQTLGLALHELATNAAKYGALSKDSGKIDISWQMSETDPDKGPVLSFLWQESGGPKVKKPKRRGFGRTVIERNVTGMLGAEVDVDFAEEGLIVRMSIPSEHASPGGAIGGSPATGRDN